MNWLGEHRVLIALSLLIIGFTSFAFTQNQSATSGLEPAAYTKIDSTSKMRKGNPKAPVSFIQYSDFLCPSCSYVSTSIMPQIDKKYIATNNVQFEFRPMAFIAEGSLQAGAGAYCAIDQDKFWPYHDAIYTYVADKIFNEGLNPQRDEILSNERIKQIAANAGLQPIAFNDCLNSQKHIADIKQSTTAANQNGITGTPYLLINGQHVTGNPSLSTVEAMIKASL